MPTFFQFTQGTESRVRFNPDSSPLLGRFRAVPRPELGRRRSSNGLFSSLRGSVNAGYGSIVSSGGFGFRSGDRDPDPDGDADSDSDGSWYGDEDAPRWQQWWRWTVKKSFDLWIEPRQGPVKRVVDKWWTRYGVLVVMPALLTVIWCAIPFPQYPLNDDVDAPADDTKIPGRGSVRVRVNFWFFLFVYYGFYNLTALIWITKVFNLYSLNWWPQSLGFPVTVALIAALSMSLPIPLYLAPATRFLTVHNTAWIAWTFIIMAMPVAIACIILTANERHLSLRHSVSETQRIFTASWWAGGSPSVTSGRGRGGGRNRPAGDAASSSLLLDGDAIDGGLDADLALQIAAASSDAARGLGRRRGSFASGLPRKWLPASFVRFIWFCLALFVGLMAYIIGEAYAEIYLGTLPHNNLETVVYVYSWVGTIHLLDGLTGWILGIKEGERVGSYPLSWVFKLYFMLTYQTYVRALYARLRSPQQFLLLQGLSSASLIILTPLMMAPFFHRLLEVLSLTDLSYKSYQKLCVRNVFIRFLAENVSMATFLSSVAVLHYGANQDVYPFFAFDDAREPYDFGLTFRYSAVTWACELAAAGAVRVVIRAFFGVGVDAEGKMDLAVWPELLPTSAAVILHVLQNMLFSIIRFEFK